MPVVLPKRLSDTKEDSSINERDSISSGHTKRLVVSLRKLPETKEDSRTNEIDSINSASNIETKSSELFDVDKNLSAKIYRKSSLLHKDKTIVDIQSEKEKSMNNNRPEEDFQYERMIMPFIRVNTRLVFAVMASFQADGICLSFAPECKKSLERRSVLLSKANVERIFLFFEKGAGAFLSIVTSSDYGRYIRQYIKLNEKFIPFYSNDSRTRDQLKFSFLMPNVVKDMSNFIRRIFSPVKLNAITHEAALNMLAISSAFNNSSLEPTTYKLVYAATEVKREDIECLADGMMLNDTIIDFYLSYIHAQIVPAQFQARIHIFSSFFYNFLMKVFSRRHTYQNRSDIHRRANNWIKHVDIFSKDFIFVPINTRGHWYLAVVCYLPQLNENSDEKTNLEDASDKNQSICKLQNARNIDHPYLTRGKLCICFFDSLDDTPDLYPAQKELADTLKRFLKMVWNNRNPKNRYEWENMLYLKAACPQQQNGVDCGLYLLQYVESFFRNPIPYFGQPMPDLRNWFPQSCVTRKKADIKKVIWELHAEKPKPTGIKFSSFSCSCLEK